MRRLALRALVTAVLATLPVVPSPAAAATHSVVARNFVFATTTGCTGGGGPVTTVQVGDTVTWRVCEGGHTVTADDGRFDSGSDAVREGETFSFTFTTPGEFDYYCRFHGGPNGVGMAGTVIVSGAPTAPTAPTRPPAATTTTTRPPTATTVGPATTTSRPATTTTAAPRSTSTSTTPTTRSTTAVPTTEDEDRGGATDPTTTTDRIGDLEEAGADDPSSADGASPWTLAALILGIVVVIAVGLWLWRRMASSTE